MDILLHLESEHEGIIYIFTQKGICIYDMKKLSNFTLYVIVCIIWGCGSKEEASPKNKENEPMNTMYFACSTLDPGASSQTLEWRDWDGLGGNPPRLSGSMTLMPNTDYIAWVQLANEAGVIGSGQFMTDEIKNEMDDHAFFYQPGNASLWTITKHQLDTRGRIYDGAISFKTGNSGVIPLKITLKHQPGLKDGTLSPGSIDIEANFNITVQ
ncbi:hypothetical protein KLP40_00720 [Hymenobacter sp. NST-14]|uniref:hypothetical protein n=1 Tax=Hymenobacter piscis TaxID=2839984 RepID=UPI001C00AF76|nr:hypothetical protein [Hymenobacter piscis]MBT9391668.1 hypothetical protein [Hymenobacter piscis]